MTVSSSVNKVIYSGNSATTVFPVSYYFLENSHLLVVLRSATGVETVQTLTTNYTVTGAGNPAGGSITMLVAPLTGTTLTIVRNVPATQETDYLANDPFPAESHERALDKLTMLVQENEEIVNRSIKIPISDSSSINLTLPASIDRAGKYLGFDTSGNAIVQGVIPDVIYYGALSTNPATRPNGTASVVGDLYFNTSSDSMRAYDGSAWVDYEADAVAAKVAAETAETNAETARDAALLAETNAESAQVAAEIARDAAFVNANVYADTAAGLAAVALDGQFQVVVGQDIIRYREDAGPVATEVARYPGALATARLAEGSPSYSNTGGQGDRTASITAFVSATLISGSGPASNLVDGATGNNYTDSITFNAISVAGLVISFDFGSGAARVITEATWKQSTTSTHGTWKWQGSSDASTWVDIGSSFTLGGATSQVQTALSANTIGYRHYRLLGVSGTASGAPFIQEVEFKTSKASIDGYAKLTEVVANTIDAAAKLKLPTNVVSYYPCDEGVGTSLRDIVGGKTADITNGGGTVAWSREGFLQLTSGWFKTPAQSTQTVVMLFRCPEGYTNYQFAAPNNDSVGQAYYGSSAATIRTLHGWGVSDVPRRSNGSGVNNLLAGGWCMVSLQIASATNNVTAIGAGNITGSGPVSSMEVAGIAILSGTASDAQLRQILNFSAEQNRPRNIFLTPWHCPRQAHLAVVVGESTSEGTFPLASLSAAQRAAVNEAVLIDARNTGSATTIGRIMKRLSLAATYANNNPPSTSSNSGLEVGLLNARINRTNDGRPLHVLKAAQGSTFLVPSGSYSNAAGGTTVVASGSTRNSGELETSGMLYLLEISNMRRMENIARNQGIGYTSVSIIYNDGLNDAYIGTGAVTSAATYQGYLQNRYDKLELMLGISNVKMISIKPHEPLGGLGGGDPDYPNNAAGTNRLLALGYIRTAFDSFKTANTADVSTLDGNSYSLNTPTDYIHPSAAGYDAMGGAAEALFAYTVSVIPRA